MKIALIAKRVSHSLGGAERVSAILSKRLAEKGHDVDVLTIYTDTRIKGVHIRPQKINTWLSPWRLISFNRKVKKILKSDRFDIVCSLCQVFPIDIYRVGDGIHQHWMRIQYPNVILRWIRYLTSLVHLTMRWLENQIFKEGNCKYFITNSRLIKNQVMEYFHISDKRIKVIYNGVDNDKFNLGVKTYRAAMRDKYSIDNDELVLLFISNNWERKGLSTIIEAVPKTGIEKIRLLVVGRGKKRRYISLVKNKMISPDKLIFTGLTDDVEKYYGMADIFVLPSRYEPFSNVCLEAMACGLPVITTGTNGASEVIKMGENGFIIDDWKDSDSIGGVIKILNNGNIREKFGENAAGTAEEYTWERHIEETSKVFDLITNRH